MTSPRSLALTPSRAALRLAPVLFVALASTAAALPVPPSGAPPASVPAARLRAEAATVPPSDGDLLPYVAVAHRVMPGSLEAALRAVVARTGRKVPSYSRQTRLACSACHYQFPALTPLGRLFKLNGYVLTGLPGITAQTDSTARLTLDLAPSPPASAMVVASFSRTRAAQPGTQNDDAALPQEFSLFLAGKIAPKVGAFTQFTYAPADGAVGIDNVDIRFASHTRPADRDLLYGLTLHNNPTVQDVWNTVPAWGFPFMASEVAPTPMASALVDGQLGQQVLGVGAYGLWNNLLYGEVTAYRSAPQGAGGSLDSTATNTGRGLMPYWRLAVQHQFRGRYLMVGTYGMQADIRPNGVVGPANALTDVAVDAQLEQSVGRAGSIVLRSTYIDERQRLHAFLAEDPPAAARLDNRLGTFRANASWYPNTTYALSGGVFATSARGDTLLYAPAPVTGSGSGRPDSRGALAELAVNPWQNVRVALQYTAYSRFNGAAKSYDAAGRSASANNTWYAYTWIAF